MEARRNLLEFRIVTFSHLKIATLALVITAMRGKQEKSCCVLAGRLGKWN